MRILGDIEHPMFKITVFKMDNRISVKIENAHYEQWYKLGDREEFNSLEKVQMLLDEAFMDRASAIFREMHSNMTKRVMPSDEAHRDESDFPNII